MRLSPIGSLSSITSIAFLLLLSTSIAAQGLPRLTSNAAETAAPKTTAQSAPKPTSTAKNKPSTTDAAPTALPALETSNGVPSGLATRKGQKAPVPTVPPTANAPYMRKSTVPEGTVFICVGAALAFVGLVVLGWRGLVAWSLHRSVRRAAMAQSAQYTQLGDAKSKSRAPGTPFYSQGPGSNLSLERLAVTSKGGSKSNTARSSLFFSPTAGAGMKTPGNRGSGYLPAGYYAAGNAAAGGGSGMTHLGGASPMSGQNKRYSRARSAGPSPPASPGTPSLTPSRGAEVAYGRPSTAGLSTQASTSTLNLSTAPQGRAPSAYLEDLFEDHSSLAPTSRDHSRRERR